MKLTSVEIMLSVSLTLTQTCMSASAWMISVGMDILANVKKVGIFSFFFLLIFKNCINSFTPFNNSKLCFGNTSFLLSCSVMHLFLRFETWYSVKIKRL